MENTFAEETVLAPVATTEENELNEQEVASAEIIDETSDEEVGDDLDETTDEDSAEEEEELVEEGEEVSDEADEA